MAVRYSSNTRVSAIEGGDVGDPTRILQNYWAKAVYDHGGDVRDGRGRKRI